MHVLMHFGLPVLVALAFYRSRWQSVALIMIATMVVDADHLLADPIYDPQRCSVGFHPLHTVPAITVYGAFFALPLLWRSKLDERRTQRIAGLIHLAGGGLLIHMALDWIDCLI